MAVKDAFNINVKTASGRNVSEYAQHLYGVLCSEIHGSPWITNAVQFSDSLDDQDKLFLEALCSEMGLIT
jgi:hypothetical protein